MSGSFSLTFPGHAFQQATTTGSISVHANAGAVSSELSNLGAIGDIHVSRSGPSAQGELAWTVTFLSGDGDVPVMQPHVDEVTGTDAAVRVSTLANGVAPVGGSLSLVVSGVPGEVSNGVGAKEWPGIGGYWSLWKPRHDEHLNILCVPEFVCFFSL